MWLPPGDVQRTGTKNDSTRAQHTLASALTWSNQAEYMSPFFSKGRVKRSSDQWIIKRGSFGASLSIRKINRGLNTTYYTGPQCRYCAATMLRFLNVQCFVFSISNPVACLSEILENRT